MAASEWRGYPELLPDVEVVAVDLPGHGERVAEEFTTLAALETIRAAVDCRLPGQRVVLAGHSLGGYLAMLYAARHPGSVDALVLIGATAEPVGVLAAVYRQFATALPVIGHDRMSRAANAVMRRLGADPRTLTGPESYAALAPSWQTVRDECRGSLLEQVDCPVTLVNGQFDQMRIHVGRFARAAGHGTRVVTVPRATHLLPLTHPDLLAEALRGATGSLDPR